MQGIHGLQFLQKISTCFGRVKRLTVLLQRTSFSSSSFSKSGVCAAASPSFCFSSSAVWCFDLSYLLFFWRLYQPVLWAQLYAAEGLLELAGTVWHGADPASPYPATPTANIYTPAPSTMFKLAITSPSNSLWHGGRGTGYWWYTFRYKLFPSCSNLIISLTAHLFHLVPVFPASVTTLKSYREGKTLFNHLNKIQNLIAFGADT